MSLDIEDFFMPRSPNSYVDVDAVVLHLVEVDGVFGDALDNLYLPPSSAPCEQGADYCDKRKTKKIFHNAFY